MQRQIVYETQRDHRPGSKGRVALGILGGVLYLIMALAVMQVAFLLWAGAWQ